MANAILEDSLPVIKLSLAEYDIIAESLAKANAVTEVLLAMPISNLEEIPARDFYYFIWVVKDLTGNANELFQGLKVSNETRVPYYS